MTLEELKKDFVKNGFVIDGDVIYKEIENLGVTINGRHPKQRFKMMYYGEGSVSNAGDSECDVFYEFDVIGDNDEPQVTLCIGSYDDFTSFVRI